MLAAFPLSNWKGRLASWLATLSPLRKLLGRVLGEVTAYIFQDNEDARDFGLQVESVEEDPTVTGPALLKYAEVHVMKLVAEARFFCQTGFTGLGKALGSALKTVTRSFARAPVNEGQQGSNEPTVSPSSPMFSEISSSMHVWNGSTHNPMTLARLTLQDFLPSFLSTKRKKHHRFSGSALALVGTTSGMKLKKALKNVEYNGKRIFADSQFLKRRWWNVLGWILKRLRTTEKLALPLVLLLGIHFFVISISFAAVATVATQAIGAYCVLVVVLMMLDALQLGAALNLS